MNVLARLLADTGASLVDARPEPNSGRQAENGAFRSLLERMGLSAPASSPDGAPAGAPTRAGDEDAETTSRKRSDDLPAATAQRIVGFPASLAHVDHKGRNGKHADANPAAAVPLPAVGTVSDLTGDAAQPDRPDAAGFQFTPSKPRGVAQRAQPSPPTAPLDVKVLVDVAASRRRLPPASTRADHVGRPLPRSPTPGETRASIAIPDPPTVVAAAVREETHLPPARPLTLTHMGELSLGERVGQRQGKQDLRSMTAPDKTAEVRHGAHVADPHTATSSSTRIPVSQQHMASTAHADGVPAEGATGGGLPASALQTLASAIGDATGPAPAKASASMTPLVEPPKPGPVRDVALKLDIPDHGALDVRMSLKGRALTVRLNAERDETAHRLRHDRDALSHLLRQAGYDATIVAIEGRRPGAALSQQAQPQSASAAGGNQAGSGAASSGGEQRASFAFDQQSQRPGHFQPGGQDRTFDETNHPRDRDRRGLYV